MIIDRLYETVNKKGNVCVGLDTSLNYIPKSLINKYTCIEDSMFEFNKRIIDATLDIAACYKVQIAYYEALGIKGLMVYKRTLEYIKSKKALSIADIKRGDIAATANMYAKAHFEGDFESDFVTLNPYMGFDTLDPYKDYIKNKEKGVFILLKTSNNGSYDIQKIKTKENKNVYNIVGENIDKIGNEFLGKSGYSCVGAVIGCTNEESHIRQKLPNTFFLIPGYGAQGGSANTAKSYLKDGNGGVINSSRKILLAYKNYGDENKFDDYARLEVIKMNKELK